MADKEIVWYVCEGKMCNGWIISGIQLVHTDDVFMSRESAAQAEFERLLEGDK